MNGEPLPPLHGFPVRLIAPGWYGVANVKWLTRIEVRDRPLPGALHGPRLRDHPRGRTRRGDRLDLHLGRARPAQVGPGEGDQAGRRLQIMGAAWGAPIAGVEVRIDDGPWQPATLTDRARAKSSPGSSGPSIGARPTPGEHTVTSRATAVDGDVQPAPDDPFLAGKTTFWESNGQITRHVRIP